MEDSRIIELYFARDESAITETAKKYGRLCLKVAGNILSSDSDVEECVNDTYLGVWNAIPPTRPNNFRNYICRIVRNVAFKRYNYNAAKKRSVELECSLSEMEDILPDESISYDVDNEYIGEAINEFLDGLDSEARVMFVRKYWFFDTVSEIASRFSFSESKVKSSLYHTREKLRKYLEEKGIRI